MKRLRAAVVWLIGIFTAKEPHPMFLLVFWLTSAALFVVAYLVGQSEV